LQIQLNGESREVSDQSSVADLVCELSLPPARVALELNRKVVRRTDWNSTMLRDGDRIEIVQFVGGGCSSLRQ